MSSSQKLTKKQKKALAFRERKGKGKAQALDEDNDVPVEENQDILEAEAQDSVMEVPTQSAKPTGAASPEDEDTMVGNQSAKSKKREREEDEGNVGSRPKQKNKKRRAPDGEDGVAVTEGDGADGEKVKQRFILFVGNLKYTTSKEAIEKHFSECDPPPSIRLLTPKPSSGKRTPKSKGCAFLEFAAKNALQQALKLHQSELDGRMINVELTAGGGGKSEERMEKLKKRNKELHEQRRKRLDKQKTKGPAEAQEGEPVHVPRPQRYSATSGVDQVPLKKRTWSVPEPGDMEANKAKKRGKRPPRAMGTGVNAIPVG